MPATAQSIGVSSLTSATDSLFGTGSARTRSHTGEPCREGSPYFAARTIGKDAFTELNTLDLESLLSESVPQSNELYGKCIEALSEVNAFMALLNPSIYIKTLTLQALLKLAKKRIIEGICSEIQEFAEEAFEDISDAIPEGEYVYKLDELFEIRVML